MKKKVPWEFAFLLLLLVYCFLRAKAGGDFDVYLDAAAKLEKGENIYLPPFINGLQYFNSPLLALLLRPFIGLPYYVPEFFWLVASAWWVWRIWKLLQWYFPSGVLRETEFRWWVGLSVMLVFRFLVANFSMIQLTIFLLWATMESLRLFRDNKNVAGGALLGFAINIKLLPLLLLPYLLYRGWWKGTGSTLLFIVIYLIVPSVFLSWNTNAFLHIEWWKIINPSNAEHIIESGNGTHSLVAFLPVYLTETTNELPIRRNYVNLTIEQVEWVVNATRLLLIILMLGFLRRMPFQPVRSRLDEIRELSYLLLLTPLLFPHQQKYAFIYIGPAVIYLLWFFIIKRRTSFAGWKGSLSLFVLISIVLSPLIGRDLIGNYIFEILQHFRVLTLAVMLLIPLLWYCKPEKIVTEIV